MEQAREARFRSLNSRSQRHSKSAALTSYRMHRTLRSWTRILSRVSALALPSTVARALAIVLCAAALSMGIASAQQPATAPSEQPAAQPAAQPAEPPPEQQAAKIPSETCLGCHGIDGFAVPGANGQMRSLYVDGSKFLNSVHGKRACVDCHQQITEVPHPKLERIKVGCITCYRLGTQYANHCARSSTGR